MGIEIAIAERAEQDRRERVKKPIREPNTRDKKEVRTAGVKRESQNKSKTWGKHESRKKQDSGQAREPQNNNTGAKHERQKNQDVSQASTEVRKKRDLRQARE